MEYSVSEEAALAAKLKVWGGVMSFKHVLEEEFWAFHFSVV